MTTVAFILWPLVSLIFFRVLAVPAAVAATIIGGYLLLPQQGGYNPPLLPAIDKTSIPVVSALVFALIFARKNTPALPGWLPRSPVLLGLIGMLIFGAVGTALTNMDAVQSGPEIFPGMAPYDAANLAMNAAVGLLPFLLARKFFATPESHRTLLMVLAVAGFGYSFLALYEVRMSPQLNVMVYGFFAHDWGQHVRGGGFRPLVFLNHALWLAIFLSCCTIALFGLARIGGTKWRPAFFLAGLWLLMTLVLAKSFGAVIITLALLLVVVVFPFRTQILVAAAVAGLLVTYPVLRANDYIPVDRIVAVLGTINAERVRSLEFRLKNEDLMLAHANERPLFGWGGYNRTRVFDESRGRMTVPDGRWVISFAQGGWIEYIGTFGLLTFAIFALALRWRRYELHPATAVVSLVLAANLLDLISNATLTSVTLLLAGALAGRLELARAEDPAAAIASSGVDRHSVGAASFPRSDGWVPTASVGVARAAPSDKGRLSQFSRFPSRPGRNL
jgi:hypothetical protein